MSEQRVLSDIPRLPREPHLEGPPAAARDSVFNYPGVVDAAGVIVDFQDANSDQRRNLATRVIATMSADSAQRMVQGLRYITSPEITESQQFIRSGEMALEAFAKYGLTPETPDDLWEQNEAIDEQAAELIGSNATLMNLANNVTEYSMLAENKRRPYVREKATELLMDPFELESQARELMELPDVIADTNKFRSQLEAYRNELMQEVLDQAGRDRFDIPDHRTMYGWLGLHMGVDYSEPMPHQAFTREVASKHLSSFMARANTPNAVVDTLYEILKGGLVNGNDDVIRHTLTILLGKTDILPGDSLQFCDYIMAPSLATGESKKKITEIQAVRAKYFAWFGKGTSIMGLNRDYLAVARAVRSTPGFKEHAKARIKEAAAAGRPARELRGEMIKLLGSSRSLANMRRGMVAKKSLGAAANENNILANAEGPLVEHFETITFAARGKKAYDYNPKKQLALIAFPGSSEIVKLPQAHISQYIRAKITEDGEHTETLSAPNYWGTLSYLLPEATTHDHLAQLRGVNERLRSNMLDSPVHTLSPRGDLMEIVDDGLNSLGFESITYRMSERNKSKIDIAVKVGNFTYEARLLPDFKLVADNEGGLLLPEASEFVQHVILTHLHEIICTDNVGEFSDTGDFAEQRKAFSSRRAHRRILEEGKRPTSKQILKILHEYGIDLIQKNRERLARGETQHITWVSQVDRIALGGKGPVVSKAPDATTALQAILRS